MRKIFLLFFFFFVFSISAFAAAPSVVEVWRTANDVSSDSSTPSASCAAAANATGYLFEPRIVNPVGDPVTSYTCQAKACPSCEQVSRYTTAIVSRQVACSGGSAPDTTKPLEQQCPDPPPTCTAGRVFEATVSMGTVGAPDMKYPTNMGGCKVVGQEMLFCESLNATTEAARPLRCRFKFRETGAPASPGEGATTPAPPTTEPTKPTPAPPHNPAQGQGCPAGLVNIGTDPSGLSICAGSGTAPAAPKPPPTTTAPPVTTNNPDGSTTETTRTTRENADGSTTTTTRTVTTNPDGTRRETENTTTGPTPSGDTGKADPTKEEQNDFCKKNPHLNACKNSTVSGSCEATSCEGDAIQCAILRQQRKEYCENTTDNASSTLGKSLLSGSDPEQGLINASFKGSTVDLSSQALDQGGFLGGGSCLADRTIEVFNQAVPVSFSTVCNNIQPLRAVILLVSLMAAYLLVSKSVLQG